MDGSGTPENPDGHNPGIDLRAAFQDELSKMSPDKQAKLVSALEDLSPKLRFGLLSALGLTEKAGEDRADRVGDDSAIDTIDDQAKEDTAKVSEVFAPELSDEERREVASTMGDLFNKVIPEGSPNEAAELAHITQQFKDQGVKKDEQGNADILKLTKLTERQKERVLSQLDTIISEEQNERANITDNEADQMANTMNSLGQIVESTGEGINADIAAQLNQLSPDDPARTELLAHQERMTGLLTRVKDFFGPGETGRDWSRKMGKTLYFAIIITILFILLEMNMINKMAGKKGR